MRIECGGWLVGEEYPRDAVEEGEQRGSEVYGGTSSPCNELPITRYMGKSKAPATNYKNDQSISHKNACGHYDLCSFSFSIFPVHE